MSLSTKNNYAIPIATSNNAQLVHCTQINPSHPSKLRYQNMTFCLRIMTFQLPLFWITLYMFNKKKIVDVAYLLLKWVML